MILKFGSEDDRDTLLHSGGVQHYGCACDEQYDKAQGKLYVSSLFYFVTCSCHKISVKNRFSKTLGIYCRVESLNLACTSEIVK